jgi:hypothetical protein
MAIKKFYLFGGCSFTDMPGSWARYLQNNILLRPKNSKNCAKSGAGHRFIATSVIDSALRIAEKGYVPDITIMWSGPSRFEIPIHELETPYVHDIFQANRLTGDDFNPGTYYHLDVTGNVDRSTLNNFWLMQCSKVSEKTRWSHQEFIDNEYIEAFNKFQQYIWNSNAHWHNTLNAILEVQWLCESKHWPYRFMTFREGLGEYIMTCAPQFRSLQDSIDWSKWLFTDDNYGGLREFTLNTVNTWDDGYDNHPSKEAHEFFVKDFLLPKLPGVYQ